MSRFAHNLTVAFPLAAMAASTVASAAEEGAKLPLRAPVVFTVFGLHVSNSMLAGWIVGIGLLVLARLALRKSAGVPGRLLTVWEVVIEWLLDLLSGILGEKMARRTFWFFGTLFIFVLCANWAGLLPGVGTVGWGAKHEGAFEVTRPLFRGADADLNTTLAIAGVFFLCWLVWAFRSLGVWGFFRHLFGPKGETRGLMGVLLIGVFLAAGVLEVVSILFRPVSLSLRLFGNIFAGETMLETMLHKTPGLNWILPVPFYLMELVVGLVQALVFTLLTAVFTMLVCESHEPAAAEGHRPVGSEGGHA